MESNLFIDLPRTHYRPGETLAGEILWSLENAPESLCLTLGWWTEGRGTKDAKIESELEWSSQALAGKEAFEFTIPASPYSFDGHLISLQWALELRVKKGKDAQTLNITVAPTDHAVELPLIDEGSKKSLSSLRDR